MPTWRWRPLFFTVGLLFLIPLFSCNSPHVAPQAGGSVPSVKLQSVVKGLTDPLGFSHSGDKSNRLFIVEQGGTIRLLKNGTLSEKPFLDIRNRVKSGGELGLLGLAFHPKFSENRRFYLNYTASPDTGLQTVISEFKVGSDPESADPASERILLTIPQPFSNHNGGQLAFGPDGHLYIGTGDGGSGNDPQENGQNLATLLGKMLRINVDAADPGKAYAVPPDNPFVTNTEAAPEIWAYGLRNPWRYSFDSATGFLFVGDVGQGAREEIDLIQKGKNYGWNIMEGTLCTPGVNPDCNKTGLELPILDYPRSEGTTVIGGYVYRGTAIPGLVGVYLYADFGSGKVWGFRTDGKSVTDHRLIFETGRNISTFGEDSQRELYLIDYAGEILKITL
jgi:glucose/arabinose dehydrogenase